MLPGFAHIRCNNNFQIRLVYCDINKTGTAYIQQSMCVIVKDYAGKLIILIECLFRSGRRSTKVFFI